MKIWSSDLRNLSWLTEELKELGLGFFITGGFMCWLYSIIRILAEIFNFWEPIK